jgi:hypothetical protein
MATPGDYLINRSVEDCNALLTQLEQARRLITRIVQRMEALGVGALAGYAWPAGYTQSDFVALYNALDALPGSIVEDATRNKVFDIVSTFQ